MPGLSAMLTTELSETSTFLFREGILYFGKMQNVAVVRSFIGVLLPSAILARIRHKDMA
jgi:hypothetical protein